jgi:plasmid stabilization system protein ParE
VFDVAITPRANADIQSNFDWWRDNRSVDQAEKWYVGVLSAIESLSHLPQRCLIVRNTDRFGREVHQLLYGVTSNRTHRIFFGIDEKNVTVYRVLHMSQNVIADENDLQ